MSGTILQTLLERDGIMLPEGGVEKSIRCFSPNHDDDDPSMSVNVVENVYYCHGCGYKGNAYTYLTEHKGMSQKEAMETLESLGAGSDYVQHYKDKAGKDKEEQSRTRSGQPRHTDKPYGKLSKESTAKLVSTYHYYESGDTERANPIIVQRWEEKKTVKEKIKIKKTFLTYTPRSEGGYWVAAPDNEDMPPEDRCSPIPLYGSQDILSIIHGQQKRPDAAKRQIWVVEGEKCRDAVASIKDRDVPPVVSPYGGSNRAVERTDWTPLYNQKVLLLADSDATGRKLMLTVGKFLTKHGAICRYFLPKGDTGYDVADALYEGGWDSMMEWINNQGGVLTHEEANPVEEEVKYEAPPLNDCQFFTVLGYQADNVVIQSKRTHYLHKIPAKSVGQEGQLIHLAPLEFWQSLAPNGKMSQPVRSAWANMVVRAAEEKGAISVDSMQMYETGAAVTEEGKIVYNAGDCLLTEGDDGLLTQRKPLLVSGQGREIYLPGPSVKLQDSVHAAQLADEMAGAVLRYRWEKPDDGKAFLGWIVTSLVGGALKFRPMIWMIGDAGTGKTFLLEEILKKLMGTMLTDVGSGSEASLANRSGCSSLPFFIDEFEPEKHKENTIAQILSLMRVASSGGTQRIRANSSGGVITLRPRFSLLVSSINKPNLDAASESRVVTIKLSETPVADWPSVRDGIYDALINEKALAIRTYIIRNTARVIQKAKIIEDKMIATRTDTRTAKIRAALSAGYWLLSGKESKVAMQRRKETDNLAPLMAMMSHFIRVDNKEMTFAECLQKAYFTEDGIWSDGTSDEQKNLRQDCQRYGFKFDREDGLLMALNYDNTRQLLARTKYENIDVDEYILNLPGVNRLYVKSGNYRRMRVAGMLKPAVQIPEEILKKQGFCMRDEEIKLDGSEKDEDTPF